MKDIKRKADAFARYEFTYIKLNATQNHNVARLHRAPLITRLEHSFANGNILFDEIFIILFHTITIILTIYIEP